MLATAKSLQYLRTELDSPGKAIGEALPDLNALWHPLKPLPVSNDLFVPITILRSPISSDTSLWPDTRDGLPSANLTYPSSRSSGRRYYFPSPKNREVGLCAINIGSPCSEDSN